jgi:hypothetical protein
MNELENRNPITQISLSEDLSSSDLDQMGAAINIGHIVSNVRVTINTSNRDLIIINGECDRNSLIQNLNSGNLPVPMEEIERMRKAAKLAVEEAERKADEIIDECSKVDPYWDQEIDVIHTTTDKNLVSIGAPVSI